ncbi:conserved hypothetical protein [Talaromyces stipitatus ATCC 10500]|uniref:Uncharacterized protein n=1 Tax=Talaromyces stipitatus (strain ATCC 10500 / CBS 375.48 / QM 6759 / NRRL 1006) TaxID=441959 RepID=B8MAV8_TALSN|nr:uncharacterized protein TSTA_115900 [Talaromyces stipitatus ATCC 10500]EED17798.1 conserved hypothetical protein [Talaromyces stipitatus ATCC 10500]
MPGNTTPGSKPPKTMSSRLLTMKFMQRAAASSSPVASEDPKTPPPKRQRLSTTTSEPATTPRSISDLDAVNAALAAEEQKRADAIARQAAEAGETNWVLDFEGPATNNVTSQPMIVAADSLDAEDQDTSYSGRKCYGGFKSKNRRNIFENVEEEFPTDPVELAAYMAAKKRKIEKEERKADRAMQKATSISGGGRPVVDDRNKMKHGRSGKRSK